MLDLPVGKALVAVYADVQCNMECGEDECPYAISTCCKGCEVDNETLSDDGDACSSLCCIPTVRKDGKHVIYKLVDYPVK